MAKEAKANAKPGGAGAAGFFGALIVLALLGGAAGYSLKFVLPPAVPNAPASADEGKAPTGKNAAKDHPPETERTRNAAETQSLVALEPILVSLAEPAGTRLRLEAYVIFGAPSKDDITLLLKEMAEDLILFLRTVTLSQIGSASGLEYLRDDLGELLQIRSKGRARGIVLKSLMIE